jgi:cysteine-rich repeat protein
VTRLFGFLSLAVSIAACGRTPLGASEADGSSAGGGGGVPGDCGNGEVDAGEACDDGNGSNSDACVGSCENAICGDGFVRTGVEACDDGNTVDNDDCRNDCAFPTCWNGIVDPGEDCDDANQSNEDACLNTCLGASCGDGFTWQMVEDCDDGNVQSTDGCVACAFAVCGDGFVWQGVEACDDGNGIDNDACRNNCTLPSCGDGVVDPGEQCDDGNSNNFDACRNNCLLPFCGDAVTDPGEQCDDGNVSNTDNCLTGCIAASCGDGFVWQGVEQCDDGNNNNFDGCRNNCLFPFCGDGILDFGEQCDDGNSNNFDACRNNCLLPVCGDAIEDPGEECDDGNFSNSDACVQGCQDAACGDGFLWQGMEQCDDGNLQNGDGCSAMCTLPVCGDGIVEGMEQCDLGAANADRPALEIQQGMLKTGVVPFDNPQDAAVFYSYFSASSHTGFEDVLTSRLYWYRDTGTSVLSLVMHHGLDNSNQPVTTVDFTFTNVPAVVTVAMADDNAMELFKQSSTTVIGDWFFGQNTDGGVLSAFPFPGSWEVTLTNAMSGGISSWEFVDDFGMTLIGLSVNQTLVLRAFATPSPCRLNCTIPECGDFILDGGEVCDDGNNIGGDGCSANCSSLN